MNSSFAILVGAVCVAASVPEFGNEERASSSRSVRVETFSEELDGGVGGLEVGADGTVYCADFGAKLGGGVPGARIWALDAQGKARVFADGLLGASGNAIGLDGVLYQSNLAANRISRVDADGTARDFLTENLRGPVGIAIDDEGVLLVANCGGGTIVECLLDGSSSVFCSSPLLPCPNGITLDSDHNLYVSNFNNGDVLQIDLEGEAKRLATLPGATTATWSTTTVRSTSSRARPTGSSRCPSTGPWSRSRGPESAGVSTVPRSEPGSPSRTTRRRSGREDVLRQRERFDDEAAQ